MTKYKLKNLSSNPVIIPIFLFILLSLYLLPAVNAEENRISAGITPDNPFLWVLDTAFEKIQLFFTFNEGKKAELMLEIADERLAEIQAMISANKTKDAERAELEREKGIEMIEKLKLDNRTREIVAERLQLHVAVLAEVLNKSPESARKGLENAINSSSRALEKFEERKIGAKETMNETEITQELNITCGYCQYLSNDTCLNYSCCQDSECKANETCIENECEALSCSSCQYAENHKCVNYECCKNEDCGINKTCVYNVCIDTAQECLRSCDDRTNWTIDYCNITTLTCEHIWIVPYCSNGICELDAGESNESCPADCEGVLEALYCTQDSDCVPACRTASWDGEKTIWGGRLPYGKCVNKNYTCEDFPTLCDTHSCQGRDGICITCNNCVNNQCVTTELDNNVWPPPCK